MSPQISLLYAQTPPHSLITPSPIAPFHREFKRQASNAIGSDTCGFIGTAPWSCAKGKQICATFATYQGCCDGTSTICTGSGARSDVATKCVEYNPSVTTTSGANLLYCGEIAPYCFTILFETTRSPGITYTNWWCWTATGSGSLADRAISVTIPGLTSLTRTSSFPGLTASSASSSSTSPSNTSILSSSTPTPTSSNATGGGSSSPSGAVIGGIVGGVLGGLLIIGAVLVAIFALYFRNRKDKYGSESKRESPLPNGDDQADGTYHSKPEMPTDNEIHEAGDGSPRLKEPQEMSALPDR